VAVRAAPLAVGLAGDALLAASAGVDDEALPASFAGAAAEVFTAGSISWGRGVSRPGEAAGVCDGADVFTPGSISCGRGVSRDCAPAGAGDVAPCASTNAGAANSTADTTNMPRAWRNVTRQDIEDNTCR
jgi:hypothetical protein